MVPPATTTARLRALPDVAVLDATSEGPEPEHIARLISIAEQGGGVLVAVRPGDDQVAALTGVEVATDEGAGEWFVTLADRQESARLEGEVALTTPLRTLTPLNGSAQVAATSSIRFEHRPVICVRPIGAGRVVAVGTIDLDATLAHPVVFTARIPVRPAASASFACSRRWRCSPCIGITI